MARETPAWRRVAIEEADILVAEFLTAGSGQQTTHAVVVRSFLDGLCTGIALAQLDPNAALVIVREVRAALEAEQPQPADTGDEFRQIYLAMARKLLGQWPDGATDPR